MAKNITIGLLLLALLQIAIGYVWLSTASTRDFNFGPPFLIMAGFFELFMAAIAAIIWNNHRKK